jgi:hypothetical protein
LVVLATTGIVYRLAQAAPQHPQRALLTPTKCLNSISPNHCYAYTTWSAVKVTGAQTVIRPESGATMSCYGCLDPGLVSDEMWLADATSSQCTAIGSCWVEAGVATFSKTDTGTCNTTEGEICVFWADNRAGGGYHIHPLFDVGKWGKDLSGYAFDVQIYNVSNPGHYYGTAWTASVTIFAPTFTVTKSQTSTNNSMTGYEARIGCEMSDVSAQAGSFDFTKNSWEDTQTNWNYRTTEGNPNPPEAHPGGGPPTATWLTPPDSTNMGGKYQTTG